MDEKPIIDELDLELTEETKKFFEQIMSKNDELFKRLAEGPSALPPEEEIYD